MDKFKMFWATLSPAAQIVAVGICLLLFVGIFYGGQSCGSKWRDAHFDKHEAQREQERQALETERNEAIGRAEAAEARAKQLEEQARVLEVTIAAQGERAEKAKEAIENESKKLEQELAAADDDVDSCTRIVRLCERAKRLGIYPAAKPCACE